MAEEHKNTANDHTDVLHRGVQAQNRGPQPGADQVRDTVHLQLADAGDGHCHNDPNQNILR